jgi:hypothetical protein
MNLTVDRILVVVALVLAVLSLVVGGFPFLTAAVICMAVAMLV